MARSLGPHVSPKIQHHDLALGTRQRTLPLRWTRPRHHDLALGTGRVHSPIRWAPPWTCSRRRAGGRFAAIAEKVALRIVAAGHCGRTVPLKIKHRDFSVTTRQRILPDPVDRAPDVAAPAGAAAGPGTLGPGQVSRGFERLVVVTGLHTSR